MVIWKHYKLILNCVIKIQLSLFKFMKLELNGHYYSLNNLVRITCLCCGDDNVFGCSVFVFVGWVGSKRDAIFVNYNNWPFNYIPPYSSTYISITCMSVHRNASLLRCWNDFVIICTAFVNTTSSLLWQFVFIPQQYVV